MKRNYQGFVWFWIVSGVVLYFIIDVFNEHIVYDMYFISCNNNFGGLICCDEVIKDKENIIFIILTKSCVYTVYKVCVCGI